MAAPTGHCVTLPGLCPKYHLVSLELYINCMKVSYGLDIQDDLEVKDLELSEDCFSLSQKSYLALQSP